MLQFARRHSFLAASTALIALTAAGCDATAHGSTPRARSASAQTVKVNLSEFRVRPQTTAVRAGRVRFVAVNAGRIDHEMVVVRTAKPAAKLAHGARASEAGSVGEISNFRPGGRKSVTLKLRPGHYALICNDPGHYRGGMHTDFKVT